MSPAFKKVMHKRKCWNTFIYLSCKWVWVRRYRGLPPLTMLGNMWFRSLNAGYSILLQWGVSHLSAKHILSKRGHIILVGGRRSIHNIMESKSIPERALGPLRLPFSLVVLATKTQPSILSPGRELQSSWILQWPFLLPLPICSEDLPCIFKAPSDFLFSEHPQPVSGFFSFPFGPLKPHHWILAA